MKDEQSDAPAARAEDATSATALQKADQRLREVLTSGDAYNTVAAIFVVAADSEPPTPPERSRYASKGDYRRELRERNAAALQPAMGEAIRMLREAGLEVSGGAIGKLLKVQGQPAALLRGLAVDGVDRAMLDAKLTRPKTAS